jgi:hypothetical protein
MDVEISELTSTVRTTDSQALLDPHVLQHIVQTVMKAVKEHHSETKRSDDDRRLAPGASARPASEWE